MSGWGAAAGAALGIVNTGIKESLNRKAASTQYRRQNTMNSIAYERQRMLNQQGADLSMDMWDKTNYGAQLKHMKDAGLNVGMMYGGGAGSGGSTGVGSGGSAPNGSVAQSAPSNGGMDIAGIAQMALLDAQRKKIDAETKLLDEQSGATKEKGTETYLANALERYLRSDQTKKELKVERDERYGEGTIHNNSMKKSTEESEVVRANQELGNMDAARQKMIVETVESSVRAELARAKINLTDEQTRKIYHDILVAYINAGMKGLDTIVKGRLGSIGNKGK